MELLSPLSLSVSPSWDTLRILERTVTVLTSCWRTALQYWERPTWGGAWQGGTVAHALTTTHWLAPKWGGQSPLLSLSNNTNTNQPNNRGRQEKTGPQERCRSRWSIPESRTQSCGFCSPFDTAKPPFLTPPSS